jgi:hypothetical protein
MLEFMELILKHDRFAIFKNAVQDAPPENCNFIEAFDNHLGWKFFNVESSGYKQDKNVFETYFTKKFNKLSEK